MSWHLPIAVTYRTRIQTAQERDWPEETSRYRRPLGQARGAGALREEDAMSPSAPRGRTAPVGSTSIEISSAPECGVGVTSIDETLMFQVRLIFNGGPRNSTCHTFPKAFSAGSSSLDIPGYRDNANSRHG